MANAKLSELRKKVRPFEDADDKASSKQMMNTLPPFFALWVIAYFSLSISVWIAIPIAVIAAGFLVRIFIIFHDCCHGSFFKNRKLNNFVGTVTGILTMFPYSKWKREHAIHHATSSNLNKRGTGDVWIMTVDEYLKSSALERLQYRLYRNPIVMFGLGPIYMLFITNRMNRKDAKKAERRNTYLTNVMILGISLLLIWLIGFYAFFVIQFTIMFVSGMAGIWLFYVQHQFEDSYFEDESEWDYVKAAIDGSSYYKLPRVLQWLTGNIGYHHVHHLSPKVPNYHLETVHEQTPPLQEATTITLRSSLKSIKFRLYDERKKTFVSFKEIKQMMRHNQTVNY